MELLVRSLLREGEEGEGCVASPGDECDRSQHCSEDHQSTHSPGYFVTSSSPSDRGGARGGKRGRRRSQAAEPSAVLKFGEERAVRGGQAGVREGAGGPRNEDDLIEVCLDISRQVRRQEADCQVAARHSEENPTISGEVYELKYQPTLLAENTVDSALNVSPPADGETRSSIDPVCAVGNTAGIDINNREIVYILRPPLLLRFPPSE